MWIKFAIQGTVCTERDIQYDLTSGSKASQAMSINSFWHFKPHHKCTTSPHHFVTPQGIVFGISDRWQVIGPCYMDPNKVPWQWVLDPSHCRSFGTGQNGRAPQTRRRAPHSEDTWFAHMPSVLLVSGPAFIGFTASLLYVVSIPVSIGFIFKLVGFIPMFTGHTPTVVGFIIWLHFTLLCCIPILIGYISVVGYINHPLCILDFIRFHPHFAWSCPTFQRFRMVSLSIGFVWSRVAFTSPRCFTQVAKCRSREACCLRRPTRWSFMWPFATTVPVKIPAIVPARWVSTVRRDGAFEVEGSG